MSPQAILAILIANLHRQSGGVSVRLCNDQYILSLYIANIRFDCQNRQSSCIAAKACTYRPFFNSHKNFKLLNIIKSRHQINLAYKLFHLHLLILRCGDWLL